MRNLTEAVPMSAIDPEQLTELDRQNFGVLSAALIKMRSESGAICQSLEDANQRLAKIYEIADKMHNVPCIMSRGQPCSASNLYLGMSTTYDGLLVNQEMANHEPVFSRRIDVEAPIEAFRVNDIAKNFNNTIHLKQEQGT